MVTYLKDYKFVNYDGNHFNLEKFSGFKDVSFVISFKNCCTVTYYCEINFSGYVCRLEAKTDIQILKEKSLFSITDEYKFIKNNKNKLYKSFQNDNFTTENESGIISDFVWWFAEKTHTVEALNQLKNKIKIVFGLLDEYKSKEIKNEQKNKKKNKKKSDFKNDRKE